MPSNYDAIREENIRRRGTDFADVGHFVANQLYADDVHFIYELLQNAEDAGARRVAFSVHPDRLEFKHYGGRPFNEQDVRAITDILRGTKKEEADSIGRFGIGFKSVFAISDDPVIHSGDEHFVIEEYIRPRGVPELPLPPEETLMVIPFKENSRQARSRIIDRLSAFGANTLLFLRNIEEVSFDVGAELSGIYARQRVVEGDHEFVKVTGYVEESSTTEEEEEDWLLFTREVHTPTGALSRPLSIAYSLEDEGRTGEKHVAAFNDALLSVCFATEQSTDLGFLVDGPFLTTSSRDNVKREEPWNHHLVEETAKLVVDSLESLKEMNLLEVSVMEAMPIVSPTRSEIAYCHGLFEPVYEAVAEAFRTKPLLPTYGGSHRRAPDVKLPRGAEIRELLGEKQVQRLFEENDPQSWLSEYITEDRTPALRLYLLQALDVQELTPESFATRVDEEFLADQPDEWICRFYGFLNGQAALRRVRRPGYGPAPIMRKPIIRLEDGTHVQPFDDDGVPKAYLPSGHRSHLPRVKSRIVEDSSALRFLEDLGLTEPNFADEVLQHVLTRYPKIGYEGDWAFPTAEENLGDIKAVVEAIVAADGSTGSMLQERASNTQFILAKNLTAGEQAFLAPRELYILTNSISDYFDENPEAFFVNHQRLAKEEQALAALGAATEVRVSSKYADFQGHVMIASSWGRHVRGLNRFDPDADMDGLASALGKQSHNLNIYIWNQLVVPNSHLITGPIEESTRESFAGSKTKEVLSTFGKLLAATAWVPGKDGQLHRPQDVGEEQLADELTPDRRTLRALSVRTAIPQEALDALGLTAEDVGFLRTNREEFERWLVEKRQAVVETSDATTQEDAFDPALYKDLLAGSFSHPQSKEGDFAVEPSPVRNPERYAERLATDLEGAIETEPQAGARFRRVPRKVWAAKSNDARVFLREQYGGRCQICDDSFAQRSGELYFEGIYLVSRTNARWLENAGNVLCLCATCAAKFEYGSVESEDLLDQIAGIQFVADGGLGPPRLWLMLCGESTSIMFTEAHLLRLKGLLTTSSS